MTQLIRAPANLAQLARLTSHLRGSVVTLGNFDGVHVGHQQLIAQVMKAAKARKVPSIVITFEPHPHEFFNKKNPALARLTRLREKIVALTACGVDAVLLMPFNQSLANISASDFINYIHAAFQPTAIIVGDDFRFGYQRQGDMALLQTMGRQLQFTAEAMPTFLVDGERVSSTRVRQALATGDLALVKRLLGHAYCMLGRIRHGDKLGREWGFPTANIYLHRQLSPLIGIYAAYVHGISEQPLPAAAYIGTRPTISGTTTLLEVHLLDFDQQIYGRYVRVEFCEKLRGEEQFLTIDALKEQIKKDVLAARRFFNYD